VIERRQRESPPTAACCVRSVAAGGFEAAAAFEPDDGVVSPTAGEEVSFFVVGFVFAPADWETGAAAFPEVEAAAVVT